MKYPLAVLTLLAACSAASVSVPVIPSLRDATAPIGSQTGVASRDIAGTWAIRRILPQNAFRPGDAFTLAARDGGLALTWAAVACSDTVNLCGSFNATVAYAADGPGRWRRMSTVNVEGTPARFWVFWIDGDRRTMAIGSPDGDFAMIVDRRTRGGADRIVAATQILDWYGFDVSTLIDFGQ